MRFGFVERRKSLIGPVGDRQRLRQEGEEHATEQASADAPLSGQTIGELGDSLFSAAQRRERQPVIRAPPLELLCQTVLAAECDLLFRMSDAGVGFPSQQPHVRREAYREHHADRLLQPSGQRHGVFDARERPIGESKEPERPRRQTQTDNAGIQPERGRVQQGLLWIVFTERALEMLARHDRVAEELVHRRHHLIGGNAERRRARLGGLCEQLLGERQEHAQVAANGVIERQSPQNREQLWRISELLTELPPAQVDVLDFGSRPSFDGSQRQPQNDVQAELQLIAPRTLGQRACTLEAAAAECDSLPVGKQGCRMLRCVEEVLCRAGEISGRVEEDGQLRR